MIKAYKINECITKITFDCSKAVKKHITRVVFSLKSDSCEYVTEYTNYVNVKMQAMMLKVPLETHMATVRNQNLAAGVDMKFWDGYTSFLWKNDIAPTGLIPYLQYHCACIHEECRVSGSFHEIENGVVPRDYLEGIILHNEQVDAIRRLIEFQRGLVDAATGSGKTEIAIGGIKRLNEIRERKVLWCTHTQPLLTQTAKRITARLNKPVGLVGDKNCDLSEKITVAMVQTLAAQPALCKELMKDVDILVLDECHNLTSPRFFMLNKCEAPYRWALSATPDKGGPVLSLRIKCLFGPKLIHLSTALMIERGIIVPPKITRMIYVDKEQGQQNTYDDGYEVDIIQNQKRHQFIRDIIKERPEEDFPFQVIIKHIKHGEELLKVFKRSFLGKNCVFLSGRDTSDAKNNTPSLIEAGKIDILISSTIFDLGVDMPNLRSIILAGAGKSAIQLLQRIGRGVRKKKGKKDVKIYDIVDKQNRYFVEHARRRNAEYKEEGFKVVTRNKLQRSGDA